MSCPAFARAVGILSPPTTPASDSSRVTLCLRVRAGLPEMFSQSDSPSVSRGTSEKLFFHISCLSSRSISAVIFYSVPLNLVPAGGAACFLLSWFSLGLRPSWCSWPRFPERQETIWTQNISLSLPLPLVLFGPPVRFQSAHGFCSVREEESGFPWSSGGFPTLGLHPSGGLLWFPTLSPHFLPSTRSGL